MPRTIARARGNLADMLTPTLLEKALRLVVESHQEGLAFVSWWTMERDRNTTDPPYPLVSWGDPKPRLTRVGNSKAWAIGYEVYMEVYGRNAPDRSVADRNAEHSKACMHAIQVFARFVELYVDRSTIVNGTPVSLRIEPIANASNFFDDLPGNEAGVAVRFVVTSDDAIDCASIAQAFP